MKILDLQLDQLEPDPDNPNVMSDAQMKALLQEIKHRGFVQPVLVRDLGDDRYRIVDGEHRWAIMGQLGAETIPCVLDDGTEIESKLRLLTMNRLRGEPIPIRLAHLLADLRTRMPEAELRKRLSMDPKDLRNYLEVADFLQEPEEPEAREPTETPPGREIAVVATQVQAETIQALLDGQTGEDRSEEGKVIADAARSWQD